MGRVGVSPAVSGVPPETPHVGKRPPQPARGKMNRSARESQTTCPQPETDIFRSNGRGRLRFGAAAERRRWRDQRRTGESVDAALAGAERRGGRPLSKECSGAFV